MRFKEIFARLPPPIFVLFVVFLVIPFASIFILGSPWQVFGIAGFWKGTIIALTYWILPPLLCYAILFKHHLFLPFYLLECMALLLHSTVFRQLLALDLLILRYVLIALMVYVGVTFANKDFLQPFLTRRLRYWRRSSRVAVNYPILIGDSRQKLEIPARIENCSDIGMAISVAKQHLDRFPKPKNSGHELLCDLHWPKGRRSLSAEIIWTSDLPASRLFGLSVEDTKTMGEFLVWIRNESNFTSPLKPVILEHQMRHTGFILWILFILISFALPAFA